MINLEGEVNITTGARVEPSEPSTQNTQLPLTIGLAILGVAFAGGGVFWWVRSNKRTENTEAQADEGSDLSQDSTEPRLDELLEAINHLDQQYEAGEINESQYRSLRSELTTKAKAILPEGK